MKNTDAEKLHSHLKCADTYLLKLCGRISELEAEKKSIIMNLSSSSRRGLHFRIAAMQAQLDAVRGITKRVSSELSTDGQIAFNNGWNALRGEILAALNGADDDG